MVYPSIALTINALSLAPSFKEENDYLIAFSITTQNVELVDLYLFFFFGLIVFSRAAPAAYGGSQARGQIRVVAAGLHHSHSNTGSELRL